MDEYATLNAFDQMVDDELMKRPANPNFRCLGAIVNRYFGQWDRMVVIERIGFVGGEYGYMVLALTPQGAKGVTNLRTARGDAMGWHACATPRTLEMDRRRLAAALGELEIARELVPEGVFWFGAVDWPLYLLHEIRSDGKAFSFGMSGYGAREEEDGFVRQLPKPPLDFRRAAELVNKGRSMEALTYGSARAKELQSAGRYYAALLELVWSASLGEPDAFIAGRVKKP
jgi:hypothetical protein